MLVNSLESPDYGIGGLVGRNSGKISGSYSTGDISGRATLGGFIGLNYNDTITGSFYDKETSGMESISSGEGTESAVALETTDFSNSSSFKSWGSSGLNIVGSSFNKPWSLNNKGRPYLYWQEVSINNGSVNGDSIRGYVKKVNGTIYEAGYKYGDSLNLDWMHHILRATEGQLKLNINDLSELENGKTYFIAAYARLSSGKEYLGDMVRFTFDDQVVSNFNSQENVSESIGQKLQAGQIKVFDLKGKFVGSINYRGITKLKELMQNYKSGIYYLQDEAGHSLKIVISTSSMTVL